tara:strand:+ start:15 stop:719 length:705 start_codon:yes stop_codon:yes gene_type:complete
MKLIWTYSPRLNRSKKISDNDMLKLFYHSIECGKKFHPTCVYTDTPEKFTGKVDQIIEIPDSFEIYFLDDIKFYVIENEKDRFTLIDGDLFINSPIEDVFPHLGVEVFVPHYKGIHYEKYNKVLEKNNVKEIIPYWEPSLGYFNLGLIQPNSILSQEFITDYRKLKQFYIDRIEGKYFNRKEECVEISLCTYFLTLYSMYIGNKYQILSKKGYIHLAGPSDNHKLNFIGNKTLL